LANPYSGKVGSKFRGIRVYVRSEGTLVRTTAHRMPHRYPLLTLKRTSRKCVSKPPGFRVAGRRWLPLTKPLIPYPGRGSLSLGVAGNVIFIHRLIPQHQHVPHDHWASTPRTRTGILPRSDGVSLRFGANRRNRAEIGPLCGVHRSPGRDHIVQLLATIAKYGRHGHEHPGIATTGDLGLVPARFAPELVSGPIAILLQ
jgi:hypothetical protein